MILAYHAIFTAYGFWLPNDPRGSWSDFVRSWELLQYGHATKVTERRSLAGDAHDRQARIDAKAAMRYPPVVFDPAQRLAVARGIAKAVEEKGYPCHACAVMPDHVHVVIGRCAERIEPIVQRFKSYATKALNADRLHPMLGLAPANDLPTPWARGRWKVFLDSPEDVLRAIAYVQQNPMKAGLPAQCWDFVTPYPV